MYKSFSLITTSHQRPQMILECYWSIAAQQILPFEWIVVIDDDNTEQYEEFFNLLEIRQDLFNIKLLKPGYIGRNEALRLAHDHVQGQCVGWIDDDDWLAPACLKKVMAKDSALVYTDYVVFNDRNLSYSQGPLNRNKYSYELMLRKNIVFHFRAYDHELYKTVGGIDDSFDTTMDYELTLRMLKSIYPQKPTKVNDNLYYYRSHHDKISRRLSSRQRENFKRASEMHNNLISL